MSMPSAYYSPPHFIKSPLPGEHTMIISNIFSNKFPGCKLVLVPTTLSYSSNQILSYRHYRLCAKAASVGKDIYRITSRLFEKDNSFAVQAEERETSADDKRSGALPHANEAKTVLDHMLENGLKPNVATFTALIDSFCKRGKLKKAFEVLEAMDHTVGCRPTVQTYNCLLKGLCYVGRVEEAFEMLADIKKEASIKPDIYTYTTLMDGFCKVGRSDEAVELLNEALEMGWTPNVVTYNTLFNGYCKEGRPVMGISVLKQMRQRNCLPDYISYSTLLHGFLLWGRIQEAMAVYKEMMANGFLVDERLTNGLVRGLCRQSSGQKDMVEDAYRVFEEMKERGFVINQSTYVSVIEALCLASKVDDATENLHEMIGLGYIPRVITMNKVIRALCAKGQIEKAVLVLVLMYETHKMPSRISYDLLICELNRQKMFLGACNVYGAALVRGVITHKKPGR